MLVVCVGAVLERTDRGLCLVFCAIEISDARFGKLEAFGGKSDPR